MMRGLKVVGLVLCASALYLGTGCTNQAGNTGTTGQSTEDIGEVLATVNGMAIGTKEFDQAWGRALPRGAQEGAQDEDAKKQEVLNKLIDDKVLYQEALKQGLDKDPKIQRMMINSLLRKDVFGTVKNNDIPDEELKQYFEEHKDEFIVPEKVQVKRILIKVDGTVTDADAKKKADEALAEVKANPDSFKDVAMRVSQDPFAKRGGDIGFISKAGKPGLDPKVVEQAFTMEAEQVSEVFKTDEGYNIIQVVSKRERVERTFDQMKGAVLRRVKTDKSKELQDKYVEDKKKTAKIEINSEKLKAHKPVVESAPQGMPGGLQGMPGMPGMGGMGGEGAPAIEMAPQPIAPPAGAPADAGAAAPK